MPKTTKSHSNTSKKTKSQAFKWHFPLNSTDLIWLAIGVGVVVLGFVLLSTGSSSEELSASVDGVWNNPIAIKVAPILLLIGYGAIIPMSLFKFFSRRKEKAAAKDTVSQV